MISIFVRKFPNCGRKFMNNFLPCGKLVKKPVNKFVEKLWLHAVDFVKMWNLKLWDFSLFTKISTFRQNYTNNVNKLYTYKKWLANLLNMSFPRFTQTSIITITIFN